MKSGGKTRILAAEDNIMNRKVLGLILNSYDLIPEFVFDGVAAVDAYRKTPNFDAILMDIMMPRMDGLEATRCIRDIERKETRKRIPILAVSANSLPQDIAKALEVGCDAFIAKPVIPAELFTLLKQYIPARL